MRKRVNKERTEAKEGKKRERDGERTKGWKDRVNEGSKRRKEEGGMK